MRRFIVLKISDNIKRLRQMRSMSVDDLAHCTGMSVDEVLCLESGANSVSLDVLLLLCVILDVVPNDIFEGLYS